MNHKKFLYAFLFVVITTIFTYSTTTYAAGAKQIYEKTQKLYICLGKWEGTGKLDIGSKTIDVKVRLEVTKAVDGWGLILNQTIEAEGMTPYKATSFLGYQPGHEHVHLFKISNYGETYDFYGYWIDEKNYELKYEGMQDSKPFVEVMTFTFKDNNTLDYSTESYLARQKYSTFSTSLKKMG
jgi:hypothetical protein